MLAPLSPCFREYRCSKTIINRFALLTAKKQAQALAWACFFVRGWADIIGACNRRGSFYSITIRNIQAIFHNNIDFG